MEPATVSLRDSDHELLAKLSGDEGRCKNRSEAMRLIIDRYNDISELDDRIDELERENARLRRELRASNARQDDVGELVDYVQEERSIQRRREEREARRERWERWERKRRSEPIWKRMYWEIFGQPVEAPQEP